MFFIDDDRTEILERSEYRGARADHDALVSTFEREPRIVALAFAQR